METKRRYFRIDFVFYNYILKCFVLIDLKVGDLTYQDLGQKQMYVHYYERELMNEGDNPPICIVLCADKSESVVKYALQTLQNHIEGLNNVKFIYNKVVEGYDGNDQLDGYIEFEVMGVFYKQ